MFVEVEAGVGGGRQGGERCLSLSLQAVGDAFPSGCISAVGSRWRPKGKNRVSNVPVWEERNVKLEKQETESKVEEGFQGLLRRFNKVNRTLGVREHL